MSPGTTTGGGNPDWLASQRRGRDVGAGGRRRARRRCAARRQDHHRRARLQSRRRERPLRHAGQSGLPGAASRRLIERVGRRSRRGPRRLRARDRHRRIGARAGELHRRVRLSADPWAGVDARASSSLRRATTRWVGSPARPACSAWSARRCWTMRRRCRVRRLVLVRDAFAMADPDGAALLAAEARRWGAVEETTVFDGAQARMARMLPGAAGRGDLAAPRAVDHGAASRVRAFDRAAFRRCGDDRAAGRDAIPRAPQRITERLHRLTHDGTGLVIPTTPGRALAKAASGAEIGAFYATALPLNAIAGHAGLPQVTLPAVRIEGCPLGLSIVGPRGADRALLKLAETLERSFLCSGDGFMGDARRG